MRTGAFKRHEDFFGSQFAYLEDMSAILPYWWNDIW